MSPVADVDDINNEHVICVYNKDFTDEEEVLEVEASLRQALGSSKLEAPLYAAVQAADLLCARHLSQQQVRRFF